jgi:hypothetical protein
MKITYTGSLPAIEIDHAGTTHRVKIGETIEVPESLGDELCARKEFKRAKADKSSAPSGTDH